MPLKDILNDIAEKHGNLQPVELPSPFDVLVDLTRWDPSWRSNDHYKGHAWAFDSVQFLLNEPQNVRAGMISILTDAITKSGSDMASGLAAMWKKETIGSLQRLSGIANPSIACVVVKELARLSQKCGVELPRQSLDDLGRLRQESFLRLAEGLHAFESILSSDFSDEIKFLQNTIR